MANPQAQIGKPVCKYGDRCYRKNPVHFQEFSHPGMLHGVANCLRLEWGAPAGFGIRGWFAVIVGRVPPLASRKVQTYIVHVLTYTAKNLAEYQEVLR